MVQKKEKSLSASAADSEMKQDEHRVFVNENGEGTFTCPACQKGVIRNLDALIPMKSAIRLKCQCSCGHVYRVLVERRTYFRKSVNFLGRYIFNDKDKGAEPMRGLIRIRDISQTGLRFSVNSPPTFKVGDTVIVEFRLDDKEQSEIREKGVVQYVQADNIVGIAFETTDRYGRLGHYLFK